MLSVYRAMILTLLLTCSSVGRVQALTYWDTDWESCATVAACGWNESGFVSLPNFLPSTELPFTGAQSLRLEWLNGVNQSWNDRSVPSQDHLFLRAVMREQPGFVLPSNFHSKMIRFTGVGGNPHIWLYRSGCGYRFDVEAPYRNAEDPLGINNNLVICSGRQMSTTKWDQVEVEVQLNTPGAANGILRLWVDEVLYITRTNVEFRGPTPTSVCGLANNPPYSCPSTMQLGSFRIFIQGGSGVRYYDRVAVGNTRIGPVGSVPSVDTTPPSPPTTFTVQ